MSEGNLKRNGGEWGIRTPDRVAPIHAFQACAFSHSANSPLSNFMWLTQ